MPAETAHGLVVVGGTDEAKDVVKPFGTKMGAKMDYVVAIDDSELTSRGFMHAFGAGGIPHAFILDRAGRIDWHGHNPWTGSKPTADP